MPLPLDTSTLTQSARARLALGLVAWAYLAALSRSAWSEASQLLTVYQELFNANRQAVLEGYPESVRSQVAAQLPNLSVTGRFDAPTRRALTAGLVVGWAPTADAKQRLLTMPTSAGALGAWWGTNLVPLSPESRRGPIWDIDLMVRGITNTPMVSQTVMRAAADVIEGVIGSTTTPTPATPPPTTAPPTFNPMLWSPGASTATAPMPAVTLPATRVGRTGEGMPTWAVWTLGLGALTGLGVLGYTIIQRRKRGRR